MLGLGRGAITALIDAGFVTPSRGLRNEYRFTFQDVVVLRTAYQLREAQIPARRMMRSLKQLKERLPEQLPLSGLRIRAIGNDVAVRTADAGWEDHSGQLLLDFEVAASKTGSVAFLQRGTSPRREARSAAEWFSQGEALEPRDPRAAEQAYLTCIRMDPAHTMAYVNLGALLCDAGRSAEALALYDEAVPRCAPSPLLGFNRAIALEDLGRFAEALRSYEQCLALAPDLADAHFNAARLHLQLGHQQSAVKHFSAYRRLEQRQQDENT
jgi:tetratricopeptide (TPR) repeat protein